MRSALLAVMASLLVAPPAAAFVGSAHSGWLWSNPTPQGRSLLALGFSGETGYAAGQFGTLLRTADGGATWSSLRSATFGLHELAVISPSTFFAAGLCVLVRSDDGGVTQRRLDFLRGGRCEPNTVAAIAFPDADTGYVFQRRRTVLRTTDGGRTFTARGDPKLPKLNDAWFTSADEGIAVGGREFTDGSIVRTTDGGDTWTRVAEASVPLRGLTFVDDRVGYAVGSGVVLRTEDGGASWTRRPYDEPHLARVACGDELRCTAVTEYGEEFHTSDGFASGTITELGQYTHAVAYPSPSRAVAVGEDGGMAISTDAGASWGTISRGVGPIGSYRGRLRRSSRRVAFNASYGPVMTTDGGRTWRRPAPPDRENPTSVTAVWFSSARVGFALSGRRLYVSPDGGESWAELGRAFSYPADVWASRDGSKIVVSGAGGVHASRDGGRHFARRLGSLGPTRHWKLDKTPGGRLFAWHAKALVDSPDGGEHWDNVRLPRRARLVRAQLVSRNVGYVMAEHGRLLRTTTRGRRWRELRSLGAFPSAREFSFADARNGWVGAHEFARRPAGWLLRTSDGGRSWRPQAVDSYSISDVLATSRRAGIVLTGVRDAFFTTTGGDLPERSELTLSATRKTVPRGGFVRLIGTLQPARAGRAVWVSMERPGRSLRRTRRVRTRPDGSFSVRFRVIREAWFVAQWAGGRNTAGAGTPAVHVRATGG